MRTWTMMTALVLWACGGDEGGGRKDAGAETGDSMAETVDSSAEDSSTEDSSTEDSSTETEDSSTEDSSTEDSSTEDSSTETEDSSTEDSSTEDSSTEDSTTETEDSMPETEDSMPETGDSGGDTIDPEGRAAACLTAEAIAADAIPATRGGDTGGAADLFALSAAGCGSITGAAGEGAPDRVMTFTAPESAYYSFGLTAAAAGTISVSTGCEDHETSCVAAAAGASATTASIELEAGESVFVVVDGGGAFTVTVNLTCFSFCAADACDVDDGCGGTCGCEADEKCAVGECVAREAGESCAEPIVLATTTFPIVYEGTTDGRPDTFSLDATCGTAEPFGAASADLVFSLTAPTTGLYPYELTGFDAGLVVAVACDDVTATCLDATDVPGVVESGALALDAGQTVYLVVDGYSNLSDVSGDFALTIEAPCVPACGGESGDVCGPSSDGCGGACGCDGGLVCSGMHTCGAPAPGDTCADAVALEGALPIEVVGTTETGAGDDYTICSDATDVFGLPIGTDVPDVVYTWVPPATADYVIAVPSALDGDPSVLSVVTSCADLAAACVLGQDLFETEDGSVTVRLDVGVRYWFVLDGYFGTGAFTLALDLAAE